VLQLKQKVAEAMASCAGGADPPEGAQARADVDDLIRLVEIAFATWGPLLDSDEFWPQEWPPREPCVRPTVLLLLPASQQHCLFCCA
jgi:hypothetical protein